MHRILFIGAGSIGERHVRCFKATGRVEVAICEPRDDPRRQVAERYGVLRAYAGLDEALRESFDAALIAAPTNHHIPIATRLAEAGLHLLIEKPLSTSLDGVEPLQKLVADRRLKAAVLYVWRASPALSAMRDAIRAGRFGMPVQLMSVSGQHFPFYRPAYREVYYRDRTAGGGAIQDVLTHAFNMGEWLVGPIDSLVADAEHKVLPGVEVEDVVHVLARHGEVMACYSLNQFQPPNEATITVHCERGSARFDMIAQRWLWADEPGGSWHVEDFGRLERDDLFIHQANALLDMLEGRREAPCTIEEAAQTLRVSLATLDSADNRFKPIQVRPVTQGRH